MEQPDKPRRDFLFLATGGVAAFGLAAVSRPLLGHMSPAADAELLQGMDIDLSKLEEGMEMRVLIVGALWQFVTERQLRLKPRKPMTLQNYPIRKRIGRG